MMKLKFNHIVIACMLYLSVCLLTTVFIAPFSMLNFIGPAAGIASALVIVWGASAFISIILSTVFFSFFVHWYVDVAFEPAVIFIATLAIILQAYVAKIVTQRYIPKQRWLNNRPALVRFILLIGPGAAVISSLAAVLVSILDSYQFNAVPIYTFVVNFSGSTLVAIFTTPIILLFAHKRQKLALSKRLYIGMVSVLVCVSVALLFKVSEQQHQHQRVESFNQYKNTMLTVLKQEQSEISDQLITVAALFKASEFVSAKEFNAFSENLFNKSLSIRGIEWVPAVSADNKGVFQQIASEQLRKKYQIVERVRDGVLQRVRERAMYTPIYYIFPQGSNDMYGYDLSTHEAQKLAMKMTAKLSLPVATPPQEIVESDFYQPKIRVYYPVYSKETNQSFGRYKTEFNNDIAGFIAAQVEFRQFFEQLALDNAQHNIRMFVEDVSVNDPFFIFGEYTSLKNRLSESVSVEFFSRHWQVSFYENDVWLLQDKTWQTWIILIGGTFAAILFQLLFLMVAVYSNELAYKVTTSTKSLIAAKDQSDKENLAKTVFLQTLSTELSTPLNVIKKLSETFPQKNLSDVDKEYLANISAATFNLGRLIDSLSELSNIDSGKMNISKQPFNFIEFIHRMESTLTVKGNGSSGNLAFSIAENTPLFINSDELRLQQLFIALAESVEGILECKTALIAIKAHMHVGNQATIFFVITPETEQAIKTEENALVGAFDSSVMHYTPKVSMVKELCVLFDGDLKLARLPSGNLMLSASIKVDVHKFTQHNEGTNFIQPSNTSEIEKDHVVLAHNSKVTDGRLYQKLLMLGYEIDVIEEGEDINSLLNKQSYKAIIFDDSLSLREMLVLSQMVKDNRQHKNINIVAILSIDLSADMIKELKKYITTFAFSSVSRASLDQLLKQNKGE